MAKILLIVPTCDGQDVGEAWVAYQWAKGLASRHDVTVLTYHKRGKTPAASQLPGVRVVEWVEPRGFGRFERLNSLMKPGYLPFYVRARRWIRKAIARGEHFDVIHQPVPVAMRYPSPGTGHGVPLVIGPVGGGLSEPPGFAGEKDTAAWYVRLRELDRFRLRRDPWLRRTYTEAACVYGIAPYVEERLAGLPVKRFEVMSETGLPALPPPPAPRPAREPGECLELLFVGRLIKTKGIRYAVEAMSLLKDLDVHLSVVGDGPDRQLCEELVQQHALADRVTFLGFLERARVETQYAGADVFVFPSYREPGGNVAWEAMAHGLPLVVCDRGGPGASADDSCAIKLDVTTPEQLVSDVAAAVRSLAVDPERLAALGQGSLHRVAAAGLWSSRFDEFDRLVEELTSAATPGAR